LRKEVEALKAAGSREPRTAAKENVSEHWLIRAARKVVG
jgi:hypothetical protein